MSLTRLIVQGVKKRIKIPNKERDGGPHRAALTNNCKTLEEFRRDSTESFRRKKQASRGGLLQKLFKIALRAGILKVMQSFKNQT